jgi:uncharacterized protein (TIGR04141 family)
MHEREYNALLPPQYGYVNLDRRLARSEFHSGRGAEVCDLLAPDGALVMVKRSDGADTLSHLATQGVGGVEALLFQADAGAAFRAHYQKQSRGRTLPADFRPSKVVFAIQLKRHQQVTADTVPPLGRIALVNAARRIQGHRIAVEVVGIPHAHAGSGGLPEAV